MDLGTAFGLLLGIGLISIGIVSNNGNLMWFLNWNSLLIVIGGTFAATLVNYPLRNIQSLLKIASTAFTRQDIDQEDVIDELVNKAEMSRKKGVLSLEKELPKVKDKFLRDGLDLAINERDPLRLRNYLELELSNVERRHSLGQEIFLYMGGLCTCVRHVGDSSGTYHHDEEFRYNSE